MRVSITGTLSELEQLWEWKKLSEILRLDYYKRSQVPDSEEFTITERDLSQAGVIALGDST